METYVIKYQNSNGRNLKKYIMANNREEAQDTFHKRFGRSARVFGADIYLNNRKS